MICKGLNKTMPGSVKACTSSSFGVPYGSLRAGIETLGVHHQSAGRGVGGSSQISRQGLASILGNRVWLGLQCSASDGCSHRRETFNFSHTHTNTHQRLPESSSAIPREGNKAAAEDAFKESYYQGPQMFIPAAKLVWTADTGLVLSLSRSVTSGEAKSTRPLYTLEQSSLEWLCFTIAC